MILGKLKKFKRIFLFTKMMLPTLEQAATHHGDYKRYGADSTMCDLWIIFFVLSFHRTDGFGDVNLGEDAPFVADTNLFMMSKANTIWGIF